jgi:hypothetical protein
MQSPWAKAAKGPIPTSPKAGRVRPSFPHAPALETYVSLSQNGSAHWRGVLSFAMPHSRACSCPIRKRTSPSTCAAGSAYGKPLPPLRNEAPGHGGRDFLFHSRPLNRGPAGRAPALRWPVQGRSRRPLPPAPAHARGAGPRPAGRRKRRGAVRRSAGPSPRRDHAEG